MTRSQSYIRVLSLVGATFAIIATAAAAVLTSDPVTAQMLTSSTAAYYGATDARL